MRGGNFFFRLELPGALVVHRGVSQGGRQLEPERRKAFWQKNVRTVAGVETRDGTVAVSLAGLQTLREKCLVLVSAPERPRVWTPRRIMESAERVSAVPPVGGNAASASSRRGGLKL